MAKMNVEHINSFTKSQIEEVIKHKKKSSFVNVAEKLLMNVEDVKLIWKVHKQKLKLEAPQPQQQQSQEEEYSAENGNFYDDVNEMLQKKIEDSDQMPEIGYEDADQTRIDYDDTNQTLPIDCGGEADVLMNQEPPIPNNFESTAVFDYHASTVKFIEYVKLLENEYLNVKQLKDGWANADHEKQKLVQDLAAANEKNRTIKTLFLEQKLELEEVKKKNDDLCRKLAANRAKCHYDSDENICVGCGKKLVFNVGNMVVCRCCADSFKSQISICGPPAANA